MTKICMVTTTHPRDDIRIFHKQCLSLSNNNYSVHLLVADGLGNEYASGVKITDVGQPKNRWARFFKTNFFIYLKLLKPKYCAIHFHDPDFVPFALLLALQGQRLIFDVHEDYFEQIRCKQYIPCLIRPLFLSLFSALIRLFAANAYGIVAATEKVAEPYFLLNKNVKVIKNYPILSEFNLVQKRERSRFKLLYAGVIAEIRCALEMAEAVQMAKSDVSLTMIGKIESRELALELKAIDKKNIIKVLPHGSRADVVKLISESHVGLCFMLPINGYPYALPTKVFEYMAGGIPFLASNFSLLSNLAVQSQAGLVVKSNAPSDIAESIDNLLSNEKEAESLGRNGREAVLRKFNWKNEEKILLKFYENLTSFVNASK